MSLESPNFSPNIRIYLEVDGQTIRLSDVLYESATLYQESEVCPGARGKLVMDIDGEMDIHDVVLEKGIALGDRRISFSYVDRAVLNGRNLSDFSSAV